MNIIATQGKDNFFTTMLQIELKSYLCVRYDYLKIFYSNEKIPFYPRFPDR